MLTVGSLFSGIGGMDLGLERAGMRVEWQVEIDEYARRVLTKHWPHVPKYGDITAIDWATVPRVDLLCGGFPCQDLSYAGKRAGLREGTRSGLWFHYLRAIRALRPRYILVENVPGLLTNHALGRVLGDLAESGYDAEWTVLSAANFGFPQLRERVWVVAYPNCNRLEEDTHEEILCLPSLDAWAKRYIGAMGSTAERLRSRPIGARPMGVDNGIPSDIHRLRGLGNAVVPQIVEAIGKMILDAHSGPTETKPPQGAHEPTT